MTTKNKYFKYLSVYSPAFLKGYLFLVKKELPFGKMVEKI